MADAAPLRVAMIGYGFMGAAHSQGWRVAPRFFDLSARPTMELLVGRSVSAVAAAAEKWGWADTATDWRDAIERPDIDVIDIVTPGDSHAEIAIAALEAGKHVLCEKPFTANAAEAELVAGVARSTGLVVMEAFHWRYHPLAARVLDLIGSGAIGAVRDVDVAFCFPLFARGDIRWQLDLAGGAFMDAGCYAVHMARTFAGAGEPTVVRATATERSPGVDATLRAELLFPEGNVRATATASMWSMPRVAATVTGDAGSIKVLNPLAPHVWHRLIVSTTAGRRREKVPGPPTYTCQLEAFVAAIETGEPFPTTVDDALANMRVIDAAYVAAGLERRRGSLA